MQLPLVVAIRRVGSFGVVLRVALFAAALSAIGCPGDEEAQPPAAQIAMDDTRAGGFFAAPFPSEERVGPDGKVDLSDFPNPKQVQWVEKVLAVPPSSFTGFGRTAGVFFHVTQPLSLDTLDAHASLAPDAAVFLVAVDGAHAGQRHPVAVRFLADGGLYGAPNLLVLLPVQGLPLAARTTYAAVVTRALKDVNGKTLGVAPSLEQLIAGVTPTGMGQPAFAKYQAALAVLDGAGVARKDLAGLTVFTTGDPTAEMRRFVDDALARPAPVPDAPWQRNEVFDDYCVYQTTIAMPDYQRGTSPYSASGGDWTYDSDGKPALQKTEEAHFVVTVPRRAMPANGFPIVVFSRTGAGGDRPLVDRGVQQVHNGPSLPGTGPGMVFARQGWAGSQIDGPEGGLRNVTHGDEQFLVFNVFNPLALRDNVRESALELVLEAHLLDGVRIDASDCAGVTTPDGTGLVRFDPQTMALFGHSMGATIAPLALAEEPRFKGAILSGAGGSWIENVVYKRSPVNVKMLAEFLINLDPPYELNEFDPLLSILQWAGEPADPPVYDEAIARGSDGSARNVLMFQGIVDTYILPPIANATSLSLGLDLAGPVLDGAAPGLAQFVPLEKLLDLDARRAIALPATGNLPAVGGAPVTGVVVQHLSDGVEDGHEVVFQEEAPKHQYGCFLSSLARSPGAPPIVPADGALADPCR